MTLTELTVVIYSHREIKGRDSTEEEREGGGGRSSSFDGPKEIFVVFTNNTARSGSEGSDKRDVRRGIQRDVQTHTQRERERGQGMSRRKRRRGGGMLLTLLLVHIVESFGPQMPPLFFSYYLLYLLPLSPLSHCRRRRRLLDYIPFRPSYPSFFLTLSVPCVLFYLASLIRTLVSMSYPVVFSFDPGPFLVVMKKTTSSFLPGIIRALAWAPRKAQEQKK